MKRSSNLASLGAFGCLLTLGSLNAAAQESPAPAARAVETGPFGDQQPGPDATPDRAELAAEIDKAFAAYDVSPQPLPEIPDDPPPHEGAMIDLPTYRIEPPDLILVEVLEALPNRPINGERLVRPDGMITLGFYGEVHVRGLTIEQTKVKLIKHLRKFLTDDTLGLCEIDPATGGVVGLIDPKDSDRVFIDVTAYNSKNHSVFGDVAAPGKIPITGNETVFDGLQHAGGFLNTADPTNVRLVRPGRNGKPGRVYRIDFDAIVERGETATNYQLFPGDRIVVGRKPIVEKTMRIDQTAGAIDTVVRSIVQTAMMARSAKQAEPDDPDALVKNLVEFWIRELKRPGDAVLDEETLRALLLRGLDVKPDAPKSRK